MFNSKSSFFKLICSLLIILFSNSTILPSAKAAYLNLPSPSQMIPLSRTYSFPVLKGLRLDFDNPLNIEFIIDAGSKDKVTKQDASRLIKYFLAGLTIPEENLWVNLSPYEKNRVIPEKLAETDLGKDLLSQDYILKQLLSSITHPESKTGKNYWQKAYEQIAKIAKTTNIPVDTFNKIWIMPESAKVYENENVALITQASLKAMLQEDMQSAKSIEREMHSAESKGHSGGNTKQFSSRYAPSPMPSAHARSAQRIAHETMRQVILPKINKDVNSGKNFSTLRQIYHSIILAEWFKQKIRKSIAHSAERIAKETKNPHALSSMSYAFHPLQAYVNQEKIKGIDLKDKDIKEKVYNLYVEAFQKGLYDYIKTEKDPQTDKTIKRRYFSGGVLASPVQAGVFQTHKSLINLQALGNISEYHVPTSVLPLQDGQSISFSSSITSSKETKPERYPGFTGIDWRTGLTEEFDTKHLSNHKDIVLTRNEYDTIILDIFTKDENFRLSAGRNGFVYNNRPNSGFHLSKKPKYWPFIVYVNEKDKKVKVVMVPEMGKGMKETFPDNIVADKSGYHITMETSDFLDENGELLGDLGNAVEGFEGGSKVTHVSQNIVSGKEKIIISEWLYDEENPQENPFYEISHIGPTVCVKDTEGAKTRHSYILHNNFKNNWACSNFYTGQDIFYIKYLPDNNTFILTKNDSSRNNFRFKIRKTLSSPINLESTNMIIDKENIERYSGFKKIDWKDVSEINGRYLFNDRVRIAPFKMPGGTELILDLFSKKKGDEFHQYRLRASQYEEGDVILHDYTHPPKKTTPLSLPDKISSWMFEVYLNEKEGEIIVEMIPELHKGLEGVFPEKITIDNYTVITKKQPEILVAFSKENISEGLKENLLLSGYAAETAPSWKKAARLLKKNKYDLIIAEHLLITEDNTLTNELKKIDKDTSIIVTTLGNIDAETAATYKKERNIEFIPQLDLVERLKKGLAEKLTTNPQASSSLKILYIDDNPDKDIKNKLSKYNLDIAANIKEGVERNNTNPYDFVVIQRLSAGHEWGRLSERLRKEKPELPIILFGSNFTSNNLSYCNIYNITALEADSPDYILAERIGQLASELAPSGSIMENSEEVLRLDSDNLTVDCDISKNMKKGRESILITEYTPDGRKTGSFLAAFKKGDISITPLNPSELGNSFHQIEDDEWLYLNAAEKEAEQIFTMSHYPLNNGQGGIIQFVKNWREKKAHFTIQKSALRPGVNLPLGDIKKMHLLLSKFDDEFEVNNNILSFKLTEEKQPSERKGFISSYATIISASTRFLGKHTFELLPNLDFLALTGHIEGLFPDLIDNQQWQKIKETALTGRLQNTDTETLLKEVFSSSLMKNQREILVIGNNSVLLRGMKSLLDTQGYETDTALNNQQDKILEMFHDNPYSLIIANADMENVEQILKSMKQERSNLPPIILTTYKKKINNATLFEELYTDLSKIITLKDGDITDSLVGTVQKLIGPPENTLNLLKEFINKPIITFLDKNNIKKTISLTTKDPSGTAMLQSPPRGFKWGELRDQLKSTINYSICIYPNVNFTQLIKSFKDKFPAIFKKDSPLSPAKLRQWREFELKTRGFTKIAWEEVAASADNEIILEGSDKSIKVTKISGKTFFDVWDKENNRCHRLYANLADKNVFYTKNPDVSKNIDFYLSEKPDSPVFDVYENKKEKKVIVDITISEAWEKIQGRFPLKITAQNNWKVTLETFSSPATNPLKILLVDDNPRDIKLSKEALEIIGYFDIETAKNGREALEKFEQEFSYNLIISDIRMPEMNGIQLLSTIRKDYPNFPFIIATSHMEEITEKNLTSDYKKLEIIHKKNLLSQLKDKISNVIPQSLSSSIEKPLKILVVDDNHYATQEIKEMLEKSGHKVDTAGNGQEGLEKLRKENGSYDYVITDKVMPNKDMPMSGINLIFKIREINPDIPAILMSNDIGDMEKRFAESAGRVNLIPKKDYINPGYNYQLEIAKTVSQFAEKSLSSSINGGISLKGKNLKTELGSKLSYFKNLEIGEIDGATFKIHAIKKGSLVKELLASAR